MSYLLKNLTWLDGQSLKTGDLRIRHGFQAEIAEKLEPRRWDKVLEFGQHFLYPGLINAHDHLEMNLYHKLGAPPYRNYVDWSHDIYKPSESPILEIQQVDIRDRLIWGGLKNLVSGACTVVHHNPWHRAMGNSNFPVKVLKKITWAHSLALEKNRKALQIKGTVPFVIHAGEGTDALAGAEIPQLDTLGLIRENTVLVHAVAINDDSIATLKERKSTIIWCPESNIFLLGKTTPIHKIMGDINVAIGTDSTLTGSSTLLDEMKMSASFDNVTNADVFKMVTTYPARAFNIQTPGLTEGNPGNLFVTPIQHPDYLSNLMMTSPADMSAVFVGGEMNLIDAQIVPRHNSLKRAITVGGKRKFIHVDLASIKTRIRKKVSSEILEKNPLWNLIEV